MPKIYLRLKHFVASWARHNYGLNGDDPGRELNVAQIPHALEVLNLVQFNVNDKVVPQCYCERQWNRMMRGEYIAKDSDNFMVDVRDERLFLTEAEVSRYAGVEPLRGESMGEFVCISIPHEVPDQNGNTVRTNSQWQLMHDAACRLYDIITGKFDEALFDYIETSIRDARKKDIDRYTNDALEVFMSLNDIRNCTDDREKNCLRRRYYRIKDRAAVKEEDATFAAQIEDEYYTGKERHREDSRCSNQRKPVICIDNGEIYESIFHAAQHFGFGYSTLRMALKRGTRCKGMTFAYQ